jgi:hypothetical protein
MKSLMFRRGSFWTKLDELDSSGMAIAGIALLFCAITTSTLIGEKRRRVSAPRTPVYRTYIEVKR